MNSGENGENSNMSPIFSNMMGAGMFLPVVKEVLNFIKGDEELAKKINLDQLKEMMKENDK